MFLCFLFAPGFPGPFTWFVAAFINIVLKIEIFRYWYIVLKDDRDWGSHGIGTRWTKLPRIIFTLLQWFTSTS